MTDKKLTDKKLTDKKLTDKKLTDRRLKPCKSCLHYKACITANYDMVKKTFECEHFEDNDLINRLQAKFIKEQNKNSKLRNERNHLQAENEKLVGNIDNLKAEIERLKPFEDKIAEFNSHIRVEDMLVFASSLEEWLEFCKNLKAEAYKECIEKVKEKNRSVGILRQGDLDNLAKEMVGKNNV